DDGTYLAVQDGEALVDVLDPSEQPQHVVGFLFDGTNSNVLYDMCARGEAPNVARLIETGVAFGHGAMSSLPTVTLANHTSIITGAHPGHHGILNNASYDRALRPAVEGLLVVVGRRPYGYRSGARRALGQLPRRQLPGAALHVVQLHAHRLGDARGRPALGDGGRVGPRQRRPARGRARRT